MVFLPHLCSAPHPPYILAYSLAYCRIVRPARIITQETLHRPTPTPDHSPITRDTSQHLNSRTHNTTSGHPYHHNNLTRRLQSSTNKHNSHHSRIRPCHRIAVEQRHNNVRQVRPIKSPHPRNSSAKRPHSNIPRSPHPPIPHKPRHRPYRMLRVQVSTMETRVLHSLPHHSGPRASLPSPHKYHSPPHRRCTAHHHSKLPCPLPLNPLLLRRTNHIHRSNSNHRLRIGNNNRMLRPLLSSTCPLRSTNRLNHHRKLNPSNKRRHRSSNSTGSSHNSRFRNSPLGQRRGNRLRMRQADMGPRASRRRRSISYQCSRR